MFCGRVAMMKRCGIVSREGWDVREELCSNFANVQELWCVNTVYGKRSVMCKKKGGLRFVDCGKFDYCCPSSSDGIPLLSTKKVAQRVRYLLASRTRTAPEVTPEATPQQSNQLKDT